MDRGLVQPASSALRVRLPLTGQLRAGTTAFSSQNPGTSAAFGGRLTGVVRSKRQKKTDTETQTVMCPPKRGSTNARTFKELVARSSRAGPTNLFNALVAFRPGFCGAFSASANQLLTGPFRAAATPANRLSSTPAATPSIAWGCRGHIRTLSRFSYGSPDFRQ